METNRDDDLVEEILEFSEDPNSASFYMQSIRRHGYEMVRQTYREAKIQNDTRQGTDNAIRNRSAYLNHLLSELNKNAAESLNGGRFKPIPTGSCFINSFSEMENALAITKEEKDTIVRFDDFLPKPFGGQGIPWPTFWGVELFTLVGNDSKSDRVKMPVRVADGRVFDVEVIRGRAFPNDNEWGILNTKDDRILKAIVTMWQEDGCKKTSGDIVKCYVRFPIRRLAKTMDYAAFGGKQMRELARDISRLGGIKYCMNFAGLPGYDQHQNGYWKTFYFIDAPMVTAFGKGKRREMIFSVTFSEFVTHSFTKRKVVTRSKDLTKQMNEIARLVLLYIESRVRLYESDKKGFRISLVNLIEKLKLPKAQWHRYKSTRYREFDRALDDLKCSTTWEGDPFCATLTETVDKSDHNLNVVLGSIIDVSPELPFAERRFAGRLRPLVARERRRDMGMNKTLEQEQAERRAAFKSLSDALIFFALEWL